MDRRPATSAAGDAEIGRAPWTLYRASQRWRYLALLSLVIASCSFDLCVISVLIEPIKKEFHASDAMLGMLSGFSFSLLNAAFGLPMARWADRGRRPGLIALAVAAWSAMTVLCGLARNYWQLSLARMGVGAAEAGAGPPVQSLVVDYFPPGRRATAIGVLGASGTVGYLLGIGLGGYVAARWGWRATFIITGAPTLLLAATIRMTLKEPREQGGGGAVAPEPLARAVRILARNRSYRLAVLALGCQGVVSFAVATFLPTFLIRSFHASLAAISIGWAGVMAASNVIGTVAGGRLADRLSALDLRWQAWLPGVACCLAAPIYIAAFLSPDMVRFFALEFVAETILAIAYSPTYAAIHAVCGAQRRSTAVSITGAVTTLLAGGLGPPLLGAMSDRLAHGLGPESLRYAFAASLLVLVPTAGLFFLLGRTIRADQAP